MDKMKKYIIISIIIVVVLIIAIVLILMNQRKAEDDMSANDIQKVVTSSSYMDVTDKSMFYQMENCLKTYYEYLGINDYTEENDESAMDDSFAQEHNIRSEQDKNNAILNLLDYKYKESNSIDENNVSEFVNPIDIDKYSYRAVKQKVATGVDTTTFYIEGEILDKDTYEIISQVYYIVYIDYNNSAFSVYPLESATDNLDQYIDDVAIERNNNNYVGTSRVSDEDMAFKYFSDFKNSALKKTDYAFNLLDSQYRETRFENDKSQFDKYIDNNIDELRGLIITQYSVNNYRDYTEYVCKDKYENLYIFKVTDFTEYTVTLDTYTIITDSFKNTYDGTNDQGKVMLNADKWIQMINNRDYTTAYKMLDETFRNNNFGSVDNFENYMRQNYGEHYKVEFGDFSNQGNTYIQELTLNTISGSGNTIEMSIIMRLNENYGFTMSFVM